MHGTRLMHEAASHLRRWAPLILVSAGFFWWERLLVVLERADVAAEHRLRLVRGHPSAGCRRGKAARCINQRRYTKVVVKLADSACLSFLLSEVLQPLRAILTSDKIKGGHAGAVHRLRRIREREIRW
jgi:hypothetical protein